MSGGAKAAAQAKKQAARKPKPPVTAGPELEQLPQEDAMRIFQPGPQYWVTHSPDLAGMPAHRLLDEAKQIEEFLNRQTTSSAASDRLQRVRDALLFEAAARDKRATRRASVKGKPKLADEPAQSGTQAPLPRFLRERSSSDSSDPAVLKAEYDEIVAYLQRDDVPKDDRSLLQIELANLKRELAQQMYREAGARRSEVLNQALGPEDPKADAATQLLDIARRIDSIRPLPGRPGLSFLMQGDQMIVLADAEVEQIRGALMKEFRSVAYDIHSGTEDVQREWQEFVDRTYDEHPYVGFFTMAVAGDNPLYWDEGFMPLVAESNRQLNLLREMQTAALDPWAGRARLLPMAQLLFNASRSGEASREFLDQRMEGMFSAARRIVRVLQVAKTTGQIASNIAFTPAGAALYAGVQTAAEQGSEVYHGQRESLDVRGILLDAGAAYVGNKVGGLIPGGGPNAAVWKRAGAFIANDRLSASATSATRMGLANLFEGGSYSAGDIVGASARHLTDVKGLIEDTVLHFGRKGAHAVSKPRPRSGTGEPEPDQQPGKRREDEQPSQASATVLTQRPKEVPPLDLPVHEINDPKKGKGVRAESNVPFERYAGWDWNHLGGGAETASSRTSIARQTEWGDTAGLDFLVQHRKTGLLVIGEQKAVDSSIFHDATAITVSLTKNVAVARDRLVQKLNEPYVPGKSGVHPDERANVEAVVKQLDATHEALRTGKPLPEGVVFEFTNVEGQGKAIGKEHLGMLSEARGSSEPGAKKFGETPDYVEHLLSRTYVRDPKLAREKGRDPSGKPGTATDPDVVPAKDLLTESARDELARMKAGKSEADWKKQKEAQKAAEEKARRAAAEAQRKALKTQRADDERKAREEAKALGEKRREERLQQLKDERAARNEPEPKTKRLRDQAERRMQRDAEQAGKDAERKAVEDFKNRRKQQDADARAKRAAEEKAAAQQREQERQRAAEEKARQQAEEKQAAERRERVEKMTPEEWKRLPAEERSKLEQAAATDKHLARAMAEKEGSLKTPEALLKLNEEARRKQQADKNESRMGKAAHYANVAAAGIRALDAFHEARDKDKSYAEAAFEAGKVYLENTNPAIGALGMAQARQEKDEKGEQYYGNDAIDAWLGTLGETGAGFIVPGSGIDQLINAGANLNAAVDDHQRRGKDPNDPELKKASTRTVTDLAADLTPSRMFSQIVGGGARAYYDVGRAIGGDASGVDKFAEDALKGKLGSIIQPWAMAADFAGNLGSDDLGTALEKTVKKTEGTTLKKLGDASGDALYELGQSAEAKSGKYGTSVQGISMMLGMTSDMIAGQSFEQALEKAAEAGKGSWADKAGSALGDAAFETVEKGKELLDEDLPAAKERLKSWWKNL